MMRLAIILIVL
ncbi:hypothetical protein OSL58_00540 [Escherichia coli]|nr:hypothetical protein [Escherichia coli]